MRLEILSGSKDPVFYPITKSKVLIGSDPSADIVLNEENISRKHLVLIQDGDNYYVYDNGSTNGSYLNEERLVPGKRVEFTSYFPVRLGTSVLVCLVSDEEASDEEEKITIPFPTSGTSEKTNPKGRRVETTDKTTVVSLKDLQAANTKTLVDRRQKIRRELDKNKKAEPEAAKKKKKKKGGLKFIHFVAVLIIAVAAYFTFVGKEPGENTDVTTNETGSLRAKPVPPPAPVIPDPPSLLRTQELYENLDYPRCQSESELILCNIMAGTSPQPWGVITVEKSFIVLIDGTSWYEQVMAMLPPPAPTETMTPEQAESYRQEIWEVAIGKYLLEGISSDEYLKLKGNVIGFGFFFIRDGRPDLQVTTALTPKALSEVRGILNSGKLRYVQQSRAKVMNFRTGYYKLNL